MILCECNKRTFEYKVSLEDYEYLSTTKDKLYHKDGYFILSLNCANEEVSMGLCEILEIHGNAALTKWFGQ